MKYVKYLNMNILKMKIYTNFIIFKNIILFLFNITKKILNLIYIILFSILTNKSCVAEWCLGCLPNLGSKVQFLLAGGLVFIFFIHLVG